MRAFCREACRIIGAFGCGPLQVVARTQEINRATGGRTTSYLARRLED